MYLFNRSKDKLQGTSSEFRGWIDIFELQIEIEKIKWDRIKVNFVLGLSHHQPF